jgi:predicted ATPase
MLKKLYVITGDSCSKIADHALMLKMKMSIQGIKSECINFPENYRHPKDHIDNLVSIINTSDNDIFILSTFSESIINGLGKMAYYQAINSNNIEIIVLKEDEVIECKYNNAGILQNWPYGFLSPTGSDYKKEIKIDYAI